MNHDYLKELVGCMRDAQHQAEEFENAVDTVLKQCDDPECMECGKTLCPYGEPLHFHHDGCPACCLEDEVMHGHPPRRSN